MTSKENGSQHHLAFTAEVSVPFRFSVLHGDDPSRRSPTQRANTRSITLKGLIFETPAMVVENFHLSFTESSFKRNSLDISLDLGKRHPKVDLRGQVEWYEKRVSGGVEMFIVSVAFLDPSADDLDTLRQFIQGSRLLKR